MNEAIAEALASKDDAARTAREVYVLAKERQRTIILAADRFQVIENELLLHLRSAMGNDQPRSVNIRSNYIRLVNDSVFHLVTYRSPNRLYGMVIDAAWLWGSPPTEFFETLTRAAHGREQRIWVTQG